MARKRFIVELGTGADLHGKDVTKAACRAVKDAIGRSCLCGLVEILGCDDLNGVHVDILVACPEPDAVNREEVAGQVPIGTKSVRCVPGGMEAPGLCVRQFAPDCDTIVVANAAVTVFVNT
uniref:Uncharacterized protein n=1 Tax=Desulfacinum infernum TaxID=35837 RepID=A0A832A374_9BACT